MAYQCKVPCLPPPTNATQCSVDGQDSCPFTDMAQCVQPCDCGPMQACSAPDSLSYQAKQPCAAPSYGAALCPTATFTPCASPCLSLHTEMCAESPSVPCGSMTCGPQPCFSGTADTCAPSSPPPCGSSCSDNCSDPQGDGGMPYVFPGSVVCLEPSGSVSVKPAVGSPELEGNTLFLASYKPHYM